MKGWPIVLSLALLVFGVSALAWVASFALLVALPRPVDTGPSLGDVLAVMDGLAKPGDRRLTSETRPGPGMPSSGTQVERAVSTSLSAALKAPREVRARVRGFSMKARQGRTPSVEQAVADRSISFIRSEFAIRNTDGSWTVLRQGEPLITAWHLKILSAFIAFALLLVPVAWLVARRLGAPMRKLAGWVERADLGDEGQGPPLGGPRELRQVARAIGEMRERLRSHVEERTVMLAAVAHDLRTPLTALRLRSEEARQPTREKMVADIGRLEQMIAQFLSFVRGAGAAAEVGEVDLGEIVSAAAASAAEAGRPVSHGALPSLKARGSAVDLRRVVENLVDNAVRFGGSAELSLEEGDGFAVLKVMDRGPGLPEQELERVFEPFYRPDASRSSETGGTGLGLAIVLAIVRAHGGEASLRNRAGGGIEAEVRLPKASASGCATGGGGKKDLRNGHLIR